MGWVLKCQSTHTLHNAFVVVELAICEKKMKTRLLIIIIAIAVFAIVAVLLFGVSHIFDNSSAYRVLDVKMNVSGVKQSYEV